MGAGDDGVELLRTRVVIEFVVRVLRRQFQLCVGLEQVTPGGCELGARFADQFHDLAKACIGMPDVEVGSALGVDADRESVAALQAIAIVQRCFASGAATLGVPGLPMS